MKTRSLIAFAALLAVSLALILSGCSKNKNNGIPGDSSSLQQLTKDENQVQNATDDVLNDVNLVLSGTPTNGFKSVSLWGGPCNATVDSAVVVNDSITYYIRYHGPNCPGTVTRNGLVQVRKKVGTHWYMPHATVIVTFINDTITHVTSGKSMILNGRKTFENVNGGVIWQLGNGVESVVHKISGDLQATFDDGTTRTWHVTRLRTLTGTPPTPTTDGHLVLTEDGFGTADGYEKLAVWGVNRNGENFYTQITQPVVHKQDCTWDPCFGIKIHQIPGKNKKATVTFGFDDNNEPVTGDQCPTRYRVDWEVNGNTGTLFLPLH
jgi:hypothetical protein